MAIVAVLRQIAVGILDRRWPAIGRIGVGQVILAKRGADRLLHIEQLSGGIIGILRDPVWPVTRRIASYCAADV